MRKEFSSTIEKIAAANDKIIFLTGDLGFMALENVRKAMKKRFINAGVSEQNMITMAAGLASEGFTVICYSISPFAIFRPAEQIRLDVCLHNMDVKIVGNGGGYGYGVMGPTHHAIEDIAVVSSFQNMKCHIPFCNEDVEANVMNMMKRKGPAYLRLGFGKKPDDIGLPAYSPIRNILKGKSLTVVGMGPVALNVLKAVSGNDMIKDAIDLFIVSEIPLPGLTDELKNSIKRSRNVVVVEEHVKRGGLGEHLSLLIMEENLPCRMTSLHAVGYPNGLYGSQGYHQKLSGLDPDSIAKKLKNCLK